jgi:NAD(P)-dependent dehydrogenase (short-subunit alcohol dehydrogenase family)
MLLEGKVAVVTGGGNGIGREISKLMGAEGAMVVVNDLGTAVDGAGQSRSAADQTVDMIKAAGGKATANYDSVATPEGGQNIIQTAVDTYGKIDILVHVAGILRDRMVFNMSIEEWDAVINVHLRGAFCVNKPACVLMRAQKSGCIINFSSISAAGNSGQANYSAAKAGILGLTRTVARDMAKYGVRANAIWPGADTRMTATVPRPGRSAPSAALARRHHVRPPPASQKMSPRWWHSWPRIWPRISPAGPLALWATACRSSKTHARLRRSSALMAGPWRKSWSIGRKPLGSTCSTCNGLASNGLGPRQRQAHRVAAAHASPGD